MQPTIKLVAVIYLDHTLETIRIIATGTHFLTKTVIDIDRVFIDIHQCFQWLNFIYGFANNIKAIVCVPHMIEIFALIRELDNKVIWVGDFDRGVVDSLGPFFELVLEKEVCIRILVNPLAKVIDLVFAKYIATTSSSITTAVPSRAIDVVKEFGEASGVVSGEVFNYFEVSHRLVSNP
jgi:hypothetical protein